MCGLLLCAPLKADVGKMARRSAVHTRSGLDTINGITVGSVAVQLENERQCLVFEAERRISRNVGKTK